VRESPVEVVKCLETGDNLTRAEFHRRYEAMPQIKKAELVEGVVFVGSRVPVRHATSHAQVMGWLGVYCAKHPELQVGDNGTVGLDADNEFQPDACLWRIEGGTAHLTDDGYLEGAPELVVEVAASSASYDLHQKLAVYRRSGVREYVVWRVLDEVVDWFELREGVFERVEPDAEGAMESRVFPGLCLPVQKLLDGDVAGVLAALG
jgi:Uma2 family endonuclease